MRNLIILIVVLAILGVGGLYLRKRYKDKEANRNKVDVGNKIPEGARPSTPAPRPQLPAPAPGTTPETRPATPPGPPKPHDPATSMHLAPVGPTVPVDAGPGQRPPSP